MTHDKSTTAAEPIIIYADGACRGNPGPGGWGVVISSGTKRKELHGGEPETTNNRMELRAAIEALKALKKEPLTVRLHTDSQYVVKGITQWLHGWKRKGWQGAGNKPVKNPDLWQELDHLNSRHHVSWMWVKGHAGNEGNERADALANLGIDTLLG